MILSKLASALSLLLPSPDKTQCFLYLSFHLILQLINGISGDLQKLLWMF